MKVETAEWLQMLSRMIKTAGKRVADADEFELARLVALQEELDQAINTAVSGQLANGRSWAHIGRSVGLTRQGAFRRYGTRTGHEPYTSA